MAYLARCDIIYDGACFHITWQCHNHDWFLEPEWAKRLYYDLLLKYKDRYGISFFSYSFMDNHPHLTGRTNIATGLSALMRTVNSQFAKTVNKRAKRRGQVVMDRFKSPVIQTDQSLLRVMAYVDLNAPRARKVTHPKEYRWCSYRYYAEGIADPLITPSPSYMAMGRSPEERQKAYRKMVEAVLADEGLAKRDYSRARYIGDPDWVQARYRESRDIANAKRAAYLMRQRRMMYAASTP
jgi:putative transposase